MYLIDKQNNKIIGMKQMTFSGLGFREREHLQEWLEANPESIGKDLLIIQKEFSGFYDTNERLDLLALDKQGNIVLIENNKITNGEYQALNACSRATVSRDFSELVKKDLISASKQKGVGSFYTLK